MITFIGRPKGEHIYVDVFLLDAGNQERVSLEPLMLTLDQWHFLVRESQRDGEQHDEDHFIWACTPDEFEQSTGETAQLAVFG